MPLTRLIVDNLRNLKHVELKPHPRLNVIYGANGSGKTSLLEAVNMLSLGRSFRSHRSKPIINYDTDRLTLYGEVGLERVTRIGVEKTRQGDTSIRVDGRNILSAAELAEHLPVLALNADSFELITGSPKLRRQLLDWLAFHVEPSFYGVWRNLQHCLKQRNSLLRRGRISGPELRPWDQQLVTLSAAIDEHRRRSFSPFLDALNSLEDLLPGVGEINLEYRRGWKRGEDYQELLEAHLEQDLLRGFTQVGPHRADIKITVNGENAADVLSRGQQKVVVAALVVAQGMVFNQHTGKQVLYLVDDLPAELDQDRSRQLGGWLSGLNAQVFITGVEQGALIGMWPETELQNAAVFHVEHGKVSQETLGAE
ncbi:DNA replication/repair protein RecF [Proteobacteria bacterium 005FR1]|nr:DNA replication/repair protein RecF [Proteobacteria bacterium 005FR1]